MTLLDDLHDALVAADFGTALGHALVVWRTYRDPALADLIDRITEGCKLPTSEGTPNDNQTWWVREGSVAAPDPVTIGGLLAVLDRRADLLDASIEAVRQRWRAVEQTPLAKHLGRSNVWPTNFHERCALLLAWPDDPRVARKLVDIARSTAPPHAHNITALYELLADRVAEIGDVRVRDKLLAIANQPRGRTERLRTWQVTFATRALAGLDARVLPPSAPHASIARCIALLPPKAIPQAPTPRPELETLWREVAAHPDDIGIRAVLGDALVEAGDLRGDLIVLQCNAKVPERPLRGANRTAYDGRVKTLLRMQWDTWFGDLALVLVRRACEFRCGMLEVATVGQVSSPAWAYAKAAGHRELACLHTVRPGWITRDDFATFVLALPRFPTTLGLTGIDMIETLGERGASFARLGTVELVRSPITGPDDQRLPDWTSKPLREALAKLAIAVPQLRELIVKDHVIAGMFAGLGREVRLLFPGLRRLAIDEATARTVRPLVDDNTFTVV